MLSPFFEANAVDGAGTANQIAYWSDADTVTSQAGLVLNPANGQLAITSVGAGALSLLRNGAGTLSMFTWSNLNAVGAIGDGVFQGIQGSDSAGTTILTARTNVDLRNVTPGAVSSRFFLEIRNAGTMRTVYSADEDLNTHTWSLDNAQVLQVTLTSLIGKSTSGGTLILESTSHATKGGLTLGTATDKVVFFGGTPVVKQSVTLTGVDLTDNTGGTASDTLADCTGVDLISLANVENNFASLGRTADRHTVDIAAIRTALVNYGLL